MKIDITPILDEKGLKIEYRGKESLRLEEANFQGPLDLDLVLIGTGKGVFVQGTITGVTILFCVSCLTDFSFPIRMTIAEEYLPLDNTLPTAEDELSLEELSIFTFGNDRVLDLSEAVRQDILLNLPMQPLCKADCRGLCPTCGKNRNEGECGCEIESLTPTEDRWAPLEALKKPNSQQRKRRNPRA